MNLVPVALQKLTPFASPCLPLYRIFILDAETGALVRELAVPGVVELSFSAKGTYLSSWERYGASFLPLDTF